MSPDTALERETIQRNLDTVRERMARAVARSGRRVADVRLMAVTKTHPWEAARLAGEAGITLFGENRVQEAVQKWTAVPVEWELRLIGHLQRNKARQAAGLFHAVDSVDKLETAQELHRHCVAVGRPCRVLLEVNTSGEATKGGVWGRDALLSLYQGILALPGIVVEGLMTVGPLTHDEAAVRRAFVELREHRDACRAARSGVDLPVLSMGMSGDYEAAVEEGSTLVRLGTALFGARPG